MSDIEKNKLIRTKLKGLVHGLKEATDILVVLSSKALSLDDMKAVGGLNDRCAIYLQEIMLMLSNDQAFNIYSSLDFIDQVEFLINEIKEIDTNAAQ